MIAVAVLIYLALTIGIGLYASRLVGGSKDFIVAGRSLPLCMNFTCVFATWFGVETGLSVSATFANEGLSAVPGDPFGLSVCLVLVALLFAKHFYRLNLLTIGDFCHLRFGKWLEVLTSGRYRLFLFVLGGRPVHRTGASAVRARAIRRHRVADAESGHYPGQGRRQHPGRTRP